MGFFKKIIIVFAIFLTTAFAFSKKSSTVLERDFILLKQINEACYEEIELKISKMLNISKIKISRDTFKDSSFVHITNQKNQPFEKDNKMQGYVGANLKFLLHLKDSSSHISLVDDKNTILNSKQVKKCDKFGSYKE